MTILAQIGQTAYTKSVQTVNAVVPSGLTQIQVLLTRVGWPSGQLFRVEIAMPDGSPGPTVEVDGGQPPGGLKPQTSMQLNWVEFDGIVSGTYVLKITIYQAMTTAITVEGF